MRVVFRAGAVPAVSVAVMLPRMTPGIAHVRAIVADLDPRCDLLRVSWPRDGLAKTAFFLETTGGSLVLKVFDDESGAWKPQKERTIFAHMRSLGIPAPEVHRVDTSRRIVPFVYSLSGRIAGAPYSHVFSSLSEGENIAMHATLGDYLGRLHATTFDRFGDVFALAGRLVVAPAHELASGETGQPLGPFAMWREMHNEIVRSRLRLMRGTGFEDLIPRVEEWFEAHDGVIEYDIVPRLLHMDLHRGNVLVAGGKVVGILDVEESIVGHNEYDLMRTELALFRGEPPTFAEAFLRAYETHVALDEGYVSRKAFYDLSRTLVWIRSLILYGDRYARGLASQSHQAARAHVLSLTTGR
jgi:aminoglycoside phosphotransferase (APT) family kinase protein